MKLALAWTAIGIIWLVLCGVIGDWIFAPHPTEFSFRILSNYVADLIILITAATIANVRGGL